MASLPGLYFRNAAQFHLGNWGGITIKVQQFGNGGNDWVPLVGNWGAVALPEVKISPPDSGEICRSVEIGHHGNIPEFRMRGYRLQTRRSSVFAEAQVCVPNDFVNGAWDDVKQCALNAAGVATISAIVASPAAALPTFKSAFMGCVKGRLPQWASRIRLGLSTEQRPVTDWTNV